MHGVVVKIKKQVNTAGSGRKKTLEKMVQGRLWVTLGKIIYAQWRTNPEIALILDFLLRDRIINYLLLRPIELGFSGKNNLRQSFNDMSSFIFFESFALSFDFGTNFKWMDSLGNSPSFEIWCWCKCKWWSWRQAPPPSICKRIL